MQQQLFGLHYRKQLVEKIAAAFKVDRLGQSLVPTEL
jgi:hypothetical protein